MKIIILKILRFDKDLNEFEKQERIQEKNRRGTQNATQTQRTTMVRTDRSSTRKSNNK